MRYDVEDFKVEVLERSNEIPVLVDFWADWCAPCKILGPVLERLAEESDGKWVLAKVDTEKYQDLAAQYGVRGIPNVKLFVDGGVAAEFVGALPEAIARQWLRKNIPSRFRKDLERAGHLLTLNQIEEAQKILQMIVESEPDDHEACVMLAETYLYSDQGKAVGLVRGIAADSRYFEAAESVRTIAGLLQKRQEELPENPVKPVYLSAINDLRLGNPDAALRKFIDVIRTDRYYDDDGSRKACIAIFRMLGEEHETTKKYRKEFSGALY